MKEYFFILGLVIGFGTQAWAVNVQGDLVRLEKNGKEATFVAMPQDGKEPREVKLSMNQIKKYLGIKNLNDLKPGDHISIEVQDTNADVWAVETLEVLVVKDAGQNTALIRNAAAVTTKPTTVTATVSETEDLSNPKYTTGTQTVEAEVPSQTYRAATVAAVPLTEKNK